MRPEADTGLHASGRSTGVLLGVIGAHGLALADPVADFYKGRPMTVIISGTTGSTYDIGTRLIVTHMSQYIPGQPQIVPKSMPGAGHIRDELPLQRSRSRRLRVRLDRRDHSDGPPSEAGTCKIRGRQFHWLGNPANTTTTIIVWHTTGVRTLRTP